MAETIKINSQEFADIQTITTAYERKIAKKELGEKSPLVMYKTMEDYETTYKTTKDSIDVGKEVKGFIKEKSNIISDFEKGYNNVVTKNINDFLNSLYKDGKGTNRQTDITMGPFKFTGNNTWQGIANAKNAGEAFSVIMNDCVPCNERAQAVKLVPDYSLLTKLIDSIAKFIKDVSELAKNLFGSDDGKVIDLCFTLNILNFTCMPDLKALVLMLGKSLSLSLELPSFKLPGLGDLIAAIIMPILAVLANLANSWINIIMIPINCLFKAITSFLEKLKISAKELIPQASFKVHFKEISLGKEFNPNVSWIDKFNPLTQQEVHRIVANGKKQTIGARQILLADQTKDILSLKLSKTQQAFLDKINSMLSTKKFIDKIIAFFNKILKTITDAKNKVQAFVMKWKSKFLTALNNAGKAFGDFATSLQEIIKLLGLLKNIQYILKIFRGQFKLCEDKEKAIENTKKEIAKAAAEAKAGSAKVKVKDMNERELVKEPRPGFTKEVYLSQEELDALNISDKMKYDNSVVTITESKEPKFWGLKRAFIETTVDLSECPTLVRREHFLSVNKIIGDI